ncbi:MAG: hypothetical protein R2794_10770 [Chitinophagales bacterium]
MPLTEADKKSMYRSLVQIMQEYCPPLVVQPGDGNGFAVMGNTPTPYGSTKKIIPGMYFASTLIRSTNVSFYFFPIYMENKKFMEVAPAAMECLDGKTCFHFKKPEQIIEQEIRRMMEIGIKNYKKSGWIK